MESTLSTQMEASMPNGAPSAPAIRKIAFVGGVAKVIVVLPVVDADGGPLTGLKNCYVFVKDTSFEGSTPEQERAANTMFVTLPLADLVGEEVTVDVPGLKYDQKYYFAASCSD